MSCIFVNLLKFKKSSTPPVISGTDCTFFVAKYPVFSKLQLLAV